MQEIKWLYPSSINEVKKYLKIDKSAPHSGGTGIIKTGFHNIETVIDTSKLKLNYIKSDTRKITIGSCSTYYDVVSKLSKIDHKHILVKSLTNSASTPLINRISIGGSLAFFPVWSDLLGPLIALDAKIKVMSLTETKKYPIIEFVKNTKIKKNSLILEVEINKNPKWKSYYYRATRTNFDIPSFNISILQNKEQTKIVVLGTTEKFTVIENYNKEAIDLLKFSNKKLGSSEYIKEIVRIEIERGLECLANS